MSAGRSGVSIAVHTSGLGFSNCPRSYIKSSCWHNPDHHALVQNSWLQQSSFSDSANRPSLLQQQDDESQSSYFHVQGQSCVLSGRLSAHRLLPGRRNNAAMCQMLLGDMSAMPLSAQLRCLHSWCPQMLTSQWAVVQMTQHPRRMCWRMARGTCSWRGRPCA